MNRRSTVVSTISILTLVVTLGGGAKADFPFGPAENLGPVINTTSGDGGGTTTSADGLELYYCYGGPGGYGGSDLWVSKRQSVKDPWGPPTNLGPTVNSPYGEAYPCLSSDGLTLYFSDFYAGTPRPGGLGGPGIWMTTRPSRNAPWTTPLKVIDGKELNICPTISGDSLTLVFTSNRGGGLGSWDLWICTRASTQDTWGGPVPLGPNVNSAGTEGECSLSADGLALFFCSNRPGGFGVYDLWVTTRKSTNDPWGPAVNLGPTVNTAANEGSAGVSADMKTLYFTSDRSDGFGGYDLWQAPILRVLDLNGDGKVDERDLLVMQQCWGRSDPLSDVGPQAWGDNVVDFQDLKVLMKGITGAEFEMNPPFHAGEVPRDVVLSWTPVPFAQTYDVYFGTSIADVNSADRARPQGVLVSQGQTATTYDPVGLLEYSRTYHWRVDFVSAGPDSTVYKGPVLDFTTEPSARPITNVTPKASSAQPGSGPEKTVDGSGLDAKGGHSTQTKDMWMSVGAVPGWIQYEFDKVYSLHELWVWNSNQPSEPSFGFGAKSVTIEYSVDGATWTALANVPEFARAPGEPGYLANTTVSFGGVSAKFVKLTITKNWGIAPRTGLSEVRFFYIPDGLAAKP